MSTSGIPTAIVHNEERQRFELRDESHLAMLHYERNGQHVIFTHTYVPDGLRGRGAATTLARHALVEARRLSWRVTARCPFVAVFLERNPEFADVVDADKTRPLPKSKSPQTRRL